MTAVAVGVSLDVAIFAAMAETVAVGRDDFSLSRSVAYLVLNALDFDQTCYALIFSVMT